MKKNYLFLGLGLLLIFTTRAQEISWAKDITTYQYGYSTSTAYDNNGNLFVAGYYSDSVKIGASVFHTMTPGAYELYLAKYDTAGNLLLSMHLPSLQGSSNPDIGVDAFGDVYFAASAWDTVYFGSTKIRANGILYGKLDNNGNLLWAKTNTDGYGSPGAVYVSPAGTFYMTGGGFNGSAPLELDNLPGTQVFSNDLSGGTYGDVWLAKVDNAGNAQWMRSGGSLNSGGSLDGDWGKGIVADQWGNVYVTGYFEGSANFDGVSLNPVGGTDLFLVKYDANGTAQWGRRAGGVSDDYAYDIAADASGRVYFTGAFKNNIQFGTNPTLSAGAQPDMFVAKYDSAGTALWSKKGGGTSYDEGVSITVNKYQVYVAGDIGANATFSGIPLNVATGTNYLVKYDYLGNILWAMNTGSGTGSSPYGVTHDTENGIYVTGVYAGGSATYGSNTLPYTGISANSFTYKLNDCPTGQLAPIGDSVYMCTGGSVVLTAPAGMSTYLWSTSATTQSITASSTGYYSADLTYPNGCKALSNVVHVTTTPTPAAPGICLVTDDSADVYNHVIWEKSLYSGVDTFIVYREISTNVYVRIGAVSNDSLSEFIDTTRNTGGANGDPKISTYHYKLSIKDTCGNESALSPWHTSIYFNDLHNGSFTWNTYAVENMTVTPITTFELLRDSNNTGYWKVIGTCAGTANILNDPQYSTFQNIANWRVQANGISCSPTMRYANNYEVQTTIVRSKSNITNNRSMSVKGAYSKGLVLYPNPFSGKFTIASEEKGIVTVYNALGEIVYEGQITDHKLTIDLADAACGIYNVAIKTEKAVTIRKIVKQ